MTLSLSFALHLIDCLNCNGFISIQEETVAFCRCSASAFSTARSSSGSSSRQVNGTNNSYSDRTSNDSVDLSTKWNLCWRVRQTGRQAVQPSSCKKVLNTSTDWVGEPDCLANDQTLHWVHQPALVCGTEHRYTWIRVCSNLIWSSQSALWPVWWSSPSPFPLCRKGPLSLLLLECICIRRSTQLTSVITMCGQLTSFVSCFKAQLGANRQAERERERTVQNRVRTRRNGRKDTRSHIITANYWAPLLNCVCQIVSA